MEGLMRVKIVKTLQIILMLTLIFISGCTGETQSQSATETTAPTSTVTVAPSATSTRRPTAKPSATPIIFPTYEPISQDEMIAWLDEKLSQPECKLPCFWGITPGETTVQDAYEIVAPYARNIFSFGADTGSKNEGFGFDFDILPYSPGDTIYSFGFNFIGDEIDYLSTSDLINYPTYSVQHILAQHGAPEEIWMEAWSSGPSWDNAPRGATFILYYPSQHFLLKYSEGSDDQIVTEDSVICCLNKWVEVVTWSSSNAETTDNFYREYFTSDFRPFLHLEDVTGMNPEAFYETFVNTTGDVCIETPLDTWLSSKSGEYD